MSGSNHSPRIEKKQDPPKYWYAHRHYLKYLLLDFDQRCAYSCQHMDRAGGIGAMDIDHFNARLKHPERNAYANLLLVTRHCNGKKGNRPTEAERLAGLRFLNPCAERDYGAHIFEDPDTFELWGATPEGRYHVRILDLNATHLLKERRVRHALRKMKKEPTIVTALREDALHGIKQFSEQVDLMIPPLPQKKKPKQISSPQSSPKIR